MLADLGAVSEGLEIINKETTQQEPLHSNCKLLDPDLGKTSSLPPSTAAMCDVDEIHAKYDRTLDRLGRFVARRSGIVLPSVLLCLLGLAIVLFVVDEITETNIEKLWVETDGRVAQELDYTDEFAGKGYERQTSVIIFTNRANEGR